MTFCSMYLEDIETRFNRVSRCDDEPDAENSNKQKTELTKIFPNIGRPGKSKDVQKLSFLERQQVHRYVLSNCDMLDDLREKYKNELQRSQTRMRKRNRAIDIDREVHLNFSTWLTKKLEEKDIDGVTEDLRCLAIGPALYVVKHTVYNINGFKFRTSGRDQGLNTQNSGVYVAAATMSYASTRDQNPRVGDVAYYGKLAEVIEVNYYDTFKVVLFKCEWADTRTDRGYKEDAYGHKMVNFSRLVDVGDKDEDEPYVLASQAKLVYYVKHPKETEWVVAVHVQPRDVYDMDEPDEE